jgi:4,5-DOPA dioxygenase extradiol
VHRRYHLAMPTATTPDAARLNTFPPIFLSHGAPTLALAPGRTGAFWHTLGDTIRRMIGTPRAIIVFSPHTAGRTPVIFRAAQHPAIHDFSGFAPELYKLRYDAPGAPDLALHVHRMMEEAGVAHAFSDTEGLDHGAWVPLMNMFADADVPVLPIALSPHMAPMMQIALGRMLAALPGEGVLVMGTGGVVHNLREVFGAGGMRAEDAPEEPWCLAFRTWVADAVAAGDWHALAHYRKEMPLAEKAHPTDEHWLPFYVAAGAAGAPRANAPVGVRLFEGVTHASLGMDAYAFGPHAQALKDALPA